MTHYTEIIRQSIRKAGRPDRDDQATAVLIEDLMRCERTALGGVSALQFDREVRGFLAAMDQLPGFARDYAEGLGLTVPEWAKAEPAGALL